MILSSVEQLEYVLKNYREYYHHERIHQSLGRIIEPIHKTDDDSDIICIERLGGLLKSYHRLAAWEIVVNSNVSTESVYAAYKLPAANKQICIKRRFICDVILNINLLKNKDLMTVQYLHLTG